MKRLLCAFCIDFTFAVSGRRRIGCAYSILSRTRTSSFYFENLYPIGESEEKKTILLSNPESSCPSIFCLNSDHKLASVYFNSCLSFMILPYTTRCNQLTLSKILLQIIFPMSKTSQFLSPMLLQESVFNSCLAI